MAKLNIDFVLMDESVVMNGFRSLMSGAKLTDFQKNPVMLFMHNRPIMYEGINTSEPLLTIGKWYDIRVQDGKLLAKPDFDDNDEFAQKIQKKVESGYYNAASIWIDPIAASDNDDLKLAGQEGPTITEWGLFEASIVDIPNCRGALAIRDETGELMQLAGNDVETRKKAIAYLEKNFTNKNKKMENKLLNAKLGLKSDADENEVMQHIDALLTLREKTSTLTAENNELKEKIQTIEQAAIVEKIDKLVNDALNEKKILQIDVEKYKKLAAVDYETTKSILDGIKPAQSVKEQLAKHAQESTSADEWTKLTWDEIDRKNKLAQLWEENPEMYKNKFKEKFGHEPKTMKN